MKLLRRWLKYAYFNSIFVRKVVVSTASTTALLGELTSMPICVPNILLEDRIPEGLERLDPVQDEIAPLENIANGGDHDPFHRIRLNPQNPVTCMRLRRRHRQNDRGPDLVFQPVSWQELDSRLQRFCCSMSGHTEWQRPLAGFLPFDQLTVGTHFSSRKPTKPQALKPVLKIQNVEQLLTGLFGNNCNLFDVPT